MKERKERKSCSPYLSNKAGKQNIKYAVAAEAAKTGSYKLKAEKMAASIKSRRDPCFSPPPQHVSRVSLVPPPLSHNQEFNAVRTSNFQIHAMKGVGKETINTVHTMKACRREEAKGHRCRPTPADREQHGGAASWCPHRVRGERKYLRLALRLRSAVFFAVCFEGQFGVARRHHICKTHRG